MSGERMTAERIQDILSILDHEQPLRSWLEGRLRDVIRELDATRKEKDAWEQRVIDQAVNYDAALDAVRKELAEARGQLINARLCFEDMEHQRNEARKEWDYAQRALDLLRGAP